MKVSTETYVIQKFFRQFSLKYWISRGILICSKFSFFERSWEFKSGKWYWWKFPQKPMLVRSFFFDNFAWNMNFKLAQFIFLPSSRKFVDLSTPKNVLLFRAIWALHWNSLPTFTILQNFNKRRKLKYRLKNLKWNKTPWLLSLQRFKLVSGVFRNNYWRSCDWKVN